MRGDLDRAVINGRARRLVEFVIKATLMQGRTRVVIPNRAALCRLLKIGQNHVAETVAELETAAILEVTEVLDGWEILVFPDCARWRCPWIYLREEMATYLAQLEQAPGQAQAELIEPEPSLSAALAEVGAEAVMGKSGTSRFGKSALPVLGSRAVPLKEGIKERALSLEGRDGRVRLPELQVSKLKAVNADEGKAGLYDIEGSDEPAAMAGMEAILTARIWANDGGKWRNRWRSDRAKTHRVFAAIVEEMGRVEVKTPGGYAEWLWKRF
jgi:hypothetical protein